MITQWSVVSFTVFSQLGAGLALFTAWKDHRDPAPSPRGWKVTAAAFAVAIAASFLAWSGPAQGAMLVAQAACATALLFALAAFRMPFAAGLASCLASIACVGAESVSAVPAAFTDPSGLFPLALFPLCTIILGAATSQLVQMGEPEDPAVRYGRFYMPLRICLWIMLVITALIPCIPWEDPIMKKTAFIWMQTQLYWMGVIFSGVVIGLSHMGRVTLIPQAVIAFASVFGLRTAFYADSIHGIFDAATLYMK